MSKVTYNCINCFQEFITNEQECFICGNKEFIEFRKIDKFKFKSGWRLHIKKMKILSKFSLEDLELLRGNINATI